jgi:hypothetical protein
MARILIHKMIKKELLIKVLLITAMAVNAYAASSLCDKGCVQDGSCAGKGSYLCQKSWWMSKCVTGDYGFNECNPSSTKHCFACDQGCEKDQGKCADPAKPYLCKKNTYGGGTSEECMGECSDYGCCGSCEIDKNKGATLVLDELPRPKDKCDGEYAIKWEVDGTDYSSDCLEGDYTQKKLAIDPDTPVKNLKCSSEKIPSYSTGPHKAKVSWCDGQVTKEFEYGEAAKPDVSDYMTQINLSKDWGDGGLAVELKNGYKEKGADKLCEQCSIDWGDLTVKTIDPKSTTASHLYFANGEYTIKYSCKCKDEENSSELKIDMNADNLVPRDEIKVLFIPMVIKGEGFRKELYQESVDSIVQAIRKNILPNCENKLEVTSVVTPCQIDLDPSTNKCENDAQVKISLNKYTKGVSNCLEKIPDGYDRVFALKDNGYPCEGKYMGFSQGIVNYMTFDTLDSDGTKDSAYLRKIAVHEFAHTFGLMDEYIDFCRCPTLLDSDFAHYPAEVNCLDASIGGSDPYPRYDASFCAGGSNCPSKYDMSCKGNKIENGNERCIMAGDSGNRDIGFCIHCKQFLAKKLSYILPGCGK